MYVYVCMYITMLFTHDQANDFWKYEISLNRLS